MLMPKPSGVPRNLTEQITGREEGASRFRIYDSHPLGLPEYWYPILWSRSLKPRRGLGLTLLGKEIALFREGGKAYALDNRCPHRGVPIDNAQCDFAGTRTCPYHGWVFELETGRLRAALTDGPESPIVKKGSVRVRTYPVEERCGLIWIYLGDDEPPPVEDDIPDEWLLPTAIITGRISERAGDWRYAVENGYDEGHVKYLHRRGVWTFWRRAPGWGWSEPRISEDGKWLTRETRELGFCADFPGLGAWPPQKWYKWRPGARGIKFRLPCTLRVAYRAWAHFEWYVPTEQGHHRYLQFICKHARGIPALWHRIKYLLYIRPFFHNQFNDQDAWMFEKMMTPPDILYRPDGAMQSVRQYYEDTARGFGREPVERYPRENGGPGAN